MRLKVSSAKRRPFCLGLNELKLFHVKGSQDPPVQMRLSVTRVCKKQGKSEGFDSCNRFSNLTQIGFKSSIFQPVWPWKFDGWPRKIIGHFYITSSFLHHLKPLGESKLELLSGNSQSGQNQRFSVPCDLKIWWMTLKINRTPFLCYIKLCASFQSHRWIQTKVTDRKRSIRVKIGDLLSRVTFKFDG